MKYRLGLDLGVSSIGSAVILLGNDNQAIDIKDAGVRIFKVSEGAETRRLKRTARKNFIRTKKRLELLARKLFENNLWVNETPQGTDKLKAKSPYKIRHDGLHEMLSNPNYIGRAILHMAKHRGAGYIAVKNELQDEILDEGDKMSNKTDSYDLMYQNLQKSGCQTLGEFFYKKILESYEAEKGSQERKNLRIIRRKEYAIKKHIVDYAIPRYLVKDEFNRFWNKQALYFSQMNKEGLKQEIYNILFYERPAAPYATGKCIYVREEDRLLKAHPLNELRRIYEETNNIRILSDLKSRKLTLEERDKIINELLLKGKNAGKQSIKKVLNLNPQQKLSLYEDKNIAAYLYAKSEFADLRALQALSDNEFEDVIEFMANPVNPADTQGRLFNEDQLIEQLKIKLKINDEKQISALLHKLPKYRCNLGKTATKKILEILKTDVISHREATDKLALNDIRFKAAEEIARENQGKHNQLPYYGEILQTETQPLPPLMVENNKSLNIEEIKYGKIANPGVHMMLNQLRQVVNDIIRIYGKPYEINIELGRDVGMSVKKKKELEVNQRQNEKLNDEAKKYLTKHQLYINNKNILKYKLAKNQGWMDAYNPTQKIDRKFQGFEIDHIIPKSKGGTDTFNNLALVNELDNKAKKDSFAYDYFVERKTPEELREILKHARNRLKKEAWRFEAGAKEQFEESGDDNETNRYLTDTRYMSKLAARYLRAIVDCCIDEDSLIRILPVKGAQTAKLRQKWYLDGLEYELLGLDIPKFIETTPYFVEQKTGEIIEGIQKPDIDGNWRFFDKKKNPLWHKKPRIDHRHHALDAITVGCVNRSLIQKMAHETDMMKIEYPLPLQNIQSVGDFRRKVLTVLKNINVSHKPEHNKNGQFHKETGRVILCTNSEDNAYQITVYVRNILQTIKSIDELNKLLVSDKIKPEWHPQILEDKIKQEKLVQDMKVYLKPAEEELIKENEQFLAEGKKELRLTETRILAKALRMLQEDKVWKGDKFKCYENNSSLINIPKHGVAYESGNNHRVDFYIKDGKTGWEVIRRFDVNQKDFAPHWKQNGGKIIWSVQQGDLFELDTPNEWKSYTDKDRCIARVKKFSDGRLTIDYAADARMTSPTDKNLKYMFVNSLDKGLSFYTKNKTRKIELTPFGKIKKKHKVLSSGTKTTP